MFVNDAAPSQGTIQVRILQMLTVKRNPFETEKPFVAIRELRLVIRRIKSSREATRMYCEHGVEKSRLRVNKRKLPKQPRTPKIKRTIPIMLLR